MSKLRNWQHEKFAEQIATGMDPREAYVLAGYERNRANHNKLLRRPNVSARIAELKRAREDAARAARVPIEQVLSELGRHGVGQVADFFERDEAGILRVRDFQQTISVEVSIALLRILQEGLGIRNV